jgi:hypothetical protein
MRDLLERHRGQTGYRYFTEGPSSLALLGMTTPVSGGFRVIRVIAVPQAAA